MLCPGLDIVECVSLAILVVAFGVPVSKVRNANANRTNFIVGQL